MPRPDEGLIHAWLDGELDAAEAARVAKLVETDAEWGAAAAEARGLIAASSRIVSKLDVIPGGVVPAGSKAAGTGTAPRARIGRRLAMRPWMRIAAVLALVAGVGYVAREPRITEQDALEEARVVPLVEVERPAEAAPPAPATPASATLAPTTPAPDLSPTLGRVVDSSRSGQRETAGAGASSDRLKAAKVSARADAIDTPPSPAPTASALGAAAVRENETRRLRTLDSPSSITAPITAPTAAPVAPPVAAPAPAPAAAPAAPAAARALAEQSAQLRPRQVIDREPSARGAADASTERVIPGCWRTRTSARSDSILVNPRILSVVRDSLVIVLSSVPLDTRTLTVEAPPRATVVQVGTSMLRGTARAAEGVAVPFEATRVSCP